MAMKLGCATMSYLFQFSLDEALGRLASVGFHDVELTTSPPHLWPRAMGEADRAAVRRLLDKHGLRVATINQRHHDNNLASINPGIREETIRQLKESIDLAADLDAPIAIIIPGKPTPLFSPPAEEIWRLAREAIEQCVEHGARRGVVCAVENVGFSLCPLASDIERMAAEIDSEFCRVHYDVANGNMYEDPARAIRGLGSRLVSVHLSDNDGKVWTHSPVGRGNIDFAAVAGALLEIGFSGASILEVMVHQDHDGAAKRAIQQFAPLGWSP